MIQKIKFKDLLQRLENHKSYIAEQAENENWNPPENFKDLTGPNLKYKKMFNQWLYTSNYEWIQNEIKKGNRYDEDMNTTFTDDDAGSSVLQRAWATDKRLDWMFDDGKYGYKKQVFLPDNSKEFESKDGKTYCSDPSLPIESQKMIQDPNNPAGCIPNPNYDPGNWQSFVDFLAQFVPDLSLTGILKKVGIMVIIGLALTYTKSFREPVVRWFGSKFVKGFLGGIASAFKDLLRGLANLARRNVKGTGAKQQRDMFFTLHKQVVDGIKKMQRSKAANPTFKSATASRGFKEMVKLLEAPGTYTTNKKIFDATLTQLFQTKKISAQVYKAAMSPRTLAKQGPIIDKFVADNGTETAWRTAKALFP
tara:strand:- start:356 stop:1450 length:1095 start_codon:yes stop_codon:yes gene_type:complete